MSIYQNICTHELDFELRNALFKKYMYFIQYIHVNTLNWIEWQATCLAVFSLLYSRYNSVNIILHRIHL